MKLTLNKLLSSQKGVSLIEVVASIVIITIVLTSFAQLFVQSNKTAAYNNEKLVTINLADAALVKLKSQTFVENTSITNMNDYFKDPSVTTLIIMNDKNYSISYSASQSGAKVTNSSYSEKELKLVKVIVTAIAPDGKIKGSSEGYVSLE